MKVQPGGQSNITISHCFDILLKNHLSILYLIIISCSCNKGKIASLFCIYLLVRVLICSAVRVHILQHDNIICVNLTHKSIHAVCTHSEFRARGPFIFPNQLGQRHFMEAFPLQLILEYKSSLTASYIGNEDINTNKQPANHQSIYIVFEIKFSIQLSRDNKILAAPCNLLVAPPLLFLG